MSNKELKVLAEWAGLCFHEWEVVDATTAYPYSRCRKCLHCGKSYSTDTDEWELPKCADGNTYFDESLDACFGWLEPELYKRGYRYELKRVEAGHLMVIFKLSRTNWAEWVVMEIEDTAALAFATAVGRLIDEGHND